MMIALLLIATLTDVGSLRSYHAAAELLDKARGPQSAAQPPALSFVLDGAVHQAHQSPRPEPPYLLTPLHEEVFVDAAADRIAHDVTVTWPSFTSRVTRVLVDGELRTIRHAQQTHDVTRSADAAFRARVARRHPDLLLRAAARNRSSLRMAGHAAFSFVDEQRVVTRVVLEPDTLRVRSAEWLDHDPLLGDLLLETRYGWNGDEVTTLRTFENGGLVVEARYSDIRRGPRASSPATATPAGYAEAAPQAPAEIEIVPLGDGVDLIRNAGGRDYHSLLIRFADHLVVVEAPSSAERAQRAIAAIRAKYPALPIRTLVTTHYHYDHIAGIRAYAAAGTEIFTTPGNVAYMRALLARPHTLAPAPPVVEPTVVAIASGHRIADEANELVLLDAGPTDHVSEILVAWLPRQKILFQGDLYRYDPGAPEPARPAALRLDELIRARGLRVQSIAGVHGEPATLEIMRESIAAAISRP